MKKTRITLNIEFSKTILPPMLTYMCFRECKKGVPSNFAVENIPNSNPWLFKRECLNSTMKKVKSEIHKNRIHIVPYQYALKNFTWRPKSSPKPLRMVLIVQRFSTNRYVRIRVSFAWWRWKTIKFEVSILKSVRRPNSMALLITAFNPYATSRKRKWVRGPLLQTLLNTNLLSWATIDQHLGIPNINTHSNIIPQLIIKTKSNQHIFQKLPTYKS